MPPVMFGPDEDQAKPDFNQMYKFQILPGRNYWFDFASNAAWENCACITRVSPLPAVSIKRGNYSRTLASFRLWTYNRDGETFYISGWHKRGGPSGALPWIQSPMRVTVAEPLTFVSFEDATDEDYNDVSVEITDY